MPDTQVTSILNEVAAGGRKSAEELFPLVYNQLRAIAQKRMAQERAGHTLQATALVNEVYMKLVGNAELRWDSRGHFFVAAAESIRRILVDHARAKLAAKRGGADRRRLDLSMAEVLDLASQDKPEETLALDEAFVRLQKEEPRAAEVVRLRFFAGLSVDDTAAALGVSRRTVLLEWSFARAWLYRALRQDHG